jgi:hypothetical protein
LRRFAEQTGGRQVYGVERPNRLNRKWTAGTGQHVVCDGYDGAAALERLKAPKCGTFVGRSDPAASRARINARGASAKVNADVTRCPSTRKASNAPRSRSRSAASRALDSM